MATSIAVGGLPNEVLDFIGDMGNDLNGFAQIVAPPFLGDDGIIDLAGGQVVVLFHAGGVKRS